MGGFFFAWNLFLTEARDKAVNIHFHKLAALEVGFHIPRDGAVENGFAGNTAIANRWAEGRVG